MKNIPIRLGYKAGYLGTRIEKLFDFASNNRIGPLGSAIAMKLLDDPCNHEIYFDNFV